MHIGLSLSLTGRLRSSGAAAPYGAIQDRAEDYIFDRAGDYIIWRATEITLTKVSDDLTANPPTISLSATSNAAGKIAYVEMNTTNTYPGRGAGDISSWNEGALTSGSNTLTLAEIGDHTGEPVAYLFISVGATDESNILTYGPFAT